MLGVVNPEGLARADREHLRNSDEEDDCLRSVLVNYLSLAVVPKSVRLSALNSAEQNRSLRFLTFLQLLRLPGCDKLLLFHYLSWRELQLA